MVKFPAVVGPIKFSSSLDKKESPSSFEASRDRISRFRRFVAVTLTTWPMLALYLTIDHHPFATPTTVMTPSWVPFWPAFALPYSAMMFVWWLLPMAIGDARRFRACLWALVFSYLLVMPWWMLVPTTLPRPALPEGWWAGYYHWLWMHDPPNNIMPCAHGMGPVVIAWFLGRDRPAWRWPLAGILLLGLPSIALTWQHRPIDILLGTLAAIFGIIMAEALIRREQRRV
jgi:hypothetical protein